MPATANKEADEKLEDEMPPDEGGGTMPSMDLAEIMGLPEVKAAIQAQVKEMGADLIAQLRKEMTPDKPPLVTTPKIGDQFTTSNASGDNITVLKHYRLDRAKAMKIPEWDMAAKKRYEENPDLVPKDPRTGLPKPIKSLIIRKGRWISIIDTHLYVYSQNQLEQIEYMKTLPRNQGGLPDLYEDTGASILECLICRPKRQFGDAKTFYGHMVATHGMTQYAELAGSAAA